MKKLFSALRLTSALLVLLTANTSQADLIWNPAAASPNGEFTAATGMGTAISYGELTLDDGVTIVDYAVKFNSAFDLRMGGSSAPSNAANNMFAVHGDGSADLYTAINRDGHVDITVCTFVQGSYNAGSNSGTPTSVTFGVTAPNQSPTTVTGSDMLAGSDVLRLNNNEQLFSTSSITAVSSPALQVETNIVGHPTNLGTAFSVPTGFSSALAWEAATGVASYGSNGRLEVNEADFNVTYTSSPTLNLRRDTDRGANSAFGFAAAVPEPSSALLLIAGLVAVGLRRQR